MVEGGPDGQPPVITAGNPLEIKPRAQLFMTIGSRSG